MKITSFHIVDNVLFKGCVNYFKSFHRIIQIVNLYVLACHDLYQNLSNDIYFREASFELMSEVNGAHLLLMFTGRSLNLICTKQLF